MVKDEGFTVTKIYAQDETIVTEETCSMQSIPIRILNLNFILIHSKHWFVYSTSFYEN